MCTSTDEALALDLIALEACPADTLACPRSTPFSLHIGRGGTLDPSWDRTLAAWADGADIVTIVHGVTDSGSAWLCLSSADRHLLLQLEGVGLAPAATVTRWWSVAVEMSCRASPWVMPTAMSGSRAANEYASVEDALEAYRETGDKRIRNQVIEDHRWLAVVIAKDYCTGSEPLDDLVQVACVALLKAAERFDPAFGVEFKTYAAVTARGELRRYYRDSTWSVRVPRRLQELRYEVRAATDVLRERLRRSPNTNELAEYLHVEPDEIIDCLCADSNFRSLSIDHADGGENLLGEDGRSGEVNFATVDSMEAFHELTSLLPDRLRRIVEMRYVDQMKQSDIAAEMGVSQVQISRLLRHATDRLRPLLEHRHRATADSAG